MANIVNITVGVAVSLLVVVGAQHYMASSVVLQASVDSVAGTAEWLELRANGTFDHTSAGLFSETITHGRYTRTDGLIHLDRLPEGGTLKRKTLRVEASSAFATGKGLWQVGPTGRIDSALAGLRIVHEE
ncbi:hypothetical protein I2I05_17905 [Hymenobacter sp. BT683]|uniref:Uncharacterized protein n=1 Tax=Hymenobacter jeongseonensis TaxID=2791027 RepID=A0ABS0ILP6_9BACT|nr:hypothetical protein [Hymenobacter jeongseonensis]MBF9239271.1 hypothetical protein [Hymenobacter jeongseonensis]